MWYLEILHVRKMFLWFAGCLVVIGILILTSNFSHHVAVRVDHVGHLSAGAMFELAGYGSCVFTTMIAATLNRDRAHLPFIWTRPTPRERIAWSYILVDLIGIVVAYCCIFAVALTVFSHVPWVSVSFDPGALVSAIRYLSIPVMWYGIIEVATSWNGLRGPLISGSSWAAFWILIGVSRIPLPSPLREIVGVLNLINPLAYFTGRHGGGIQLTDAPMHTIPLDYTAQTFLAYGIAVVALTLAVYAWKRMEV